MSIQMFVKTHPQSPETLTKTSSPRLLAENRGNAYFLHRTVTNDKGHSCLSGRTVKALPNC